MCGGREKVSAQSLQATCHRKILTRAKPIHLLLHQRKRSPTLWGGGLSSPDALRVGGLSFERSKFVLKICQGSASCSRPQEMPELGQREGGGQINRSGEGGLPAGAPDPSHRHSSILKSKRRRVHCILSSASVRDADSCLQTWS